MPGATGPTGIAALVLAKSTTVPTEPATGALAPTVTCWATAEPASSAANTEPITFFLMPQMLADRARDEAVTSLGPSNHCHGYRFRASGVRLRDRAMGKRGDEASSRFPYGVALASLGLGLTLFFANTVPALRERQGLADLEVELGDLRRQYEDAIQKAALGGGNRMDYDLQSLLVAIDQQGFTPLELCSAYPPPAADDAPQGTPR